MSEEEIMKFLSCNDCKFATCEQCEINQTTKKAIKELIEKQSNKIKDIKTRLEYYLIENMSFNKESQEEFKKLLKILEGVD